MKTRFNLFFFFLTILASSCNKEKPMSKVIDEALSLSGKQYEALAQVMQGKPDLVPRSIDTAGVLVTAKSGWWTSGFFPGS